MLSEIRLWSVADYHRMGEAGIFHPEERVELIAGQIVKMSAKGTAHEAAITRVERTLRNQLGDRVLIRLQSPIQLDDYSEPEPDVAVARVDPLDYEDHHPTPAEVYLVIEVADTSFKFDCGPKANLYARSGLADYWVLDVNNRQLHVFRQPNPDGYQSHQILSQADGISLLLFPDVRVVVQSLLRKLS